MRVAWLPITEWLPQYTAKLFGVDAIAGLTLAFFVMPESLAYASLAGLPPQYGIYCCLAGGLIFALLTTTRQVAVGPTSAISLMIGSTVAGMAGGDPTRWLAIAQLTAFLVGLLCILAYLLRANAIVNFISENILLGFKAGAALSIASTQLPKMLGITPDGGHFFSRIYNVAMKIPQTEPVTLMIGLAAFTILVLGMRFLPGKPVSLVVLIASIVLMNTTPLASFGVHLVGSIQSGLPELGFPTLRVSDVDGVVGLALACFLMSYIETVSSGRAFAQKHGYALNARQELLSLGMANIASGIASGFVVAGGLSQSTVNDKAGARTSVAVIVCSLALGVLLFFTDLLATLPEVILAAIVLDAVIGLIKVKEMRRLYHLSKKEFIISMVALVSVLTFGILIGVLLAAAVSITLLIVRAANPPVVVLGRVRGTHIYSNVVRESDTETFDGLMIIRVESSYFYFNVDTIKQQILALIHSAEQPIRTVILNMATSPTIDVAGANMLQELSRQLLEAGIEFRIAEARYGVRELLHKLDMETYVGPLDRGVSCEDAVEAWLATEGRPAVST